MINKVFKTLPKTAKFLSTQMYFVSTNDALINVPSSKYIDNREALKENIWRDIDESGKKSEKTHLSVSEQLIKEIPVLKSHDDVVRCMGGTIPGSGHPVVYIQLNTYKPGEPVSCKYCGLRYALDTHHH